MDLSIELAQRRLAVEAALEKLMPASNTYPPLIHEAMRYAIFNGGKRLRPILLMEAARLAGGDPEAVLPAACALEMIHSYSLVHDDLPAMDDDDLRRGKPTCHIVFGEATAILAGDALLTRAFELMEFQRAARTELVVEAWAEMARAAGSQGMIAGQVIDLQSENIALDADSLVNLHRLKTGALFRASLKMGALLSGAADDQAAALQAYADNFGLCFQITDDILDVTGNEAETGKPQGSDAKSNKATFVSIFGMEKACKMAEERAREAVRALGIFGEQGQFLQLLAESLINRKT